ncbi:hypothetical protein BN1080_02870 [Planococcus massiliensis]|uniref:DUF2007 domain-containing protein n=2 Tax=Planococcus massiliensis TaxID=1499687 RepID=A0A098ENJ6_9BACL|nr:hypothetical protein BN1080_02870 [Planococcus massiliensis]
MMGLIRFLFFKKKCLVHSAFGHEMYFRAAGQLQANGVPFDAVRKINASSLGSAGSDIPFVRAAETNNAQYDFYVKKEDEHLAHQALR